MEKEKGKEREKVGSATCSTRAQWPIYSCMLQVATAVLSVTAKKAKAKLKKQASSFLPSTSSSATTVTEGKEEGGEAMEVVGKSLCMM